MTYEAKFQSSLVTWFSHTWPELTGAFFQINNTSTSKVAEGFIPGVSDMCLAIAPTAFIELKMKGKAHNIKHIRCQWRWGQDAIKRGCLFIMSHDENEIKAFITAIIDGGNYTEIMKRNTLIMGDLINNCKKSTIIIC